MLERGLGRDRVAEPAGGELERSVHVLDLDHGLELDARALRPLEQLPAGRVAPAVVRVVEDQRRGGEPLDRDRLALRISSVPSFCAAVLKSWTGASPY